MIRCCEVDFTLEEEILNFNVSNSTLSFETDLGYLQGIQSYNTLSDKPKINNVTLIGNKVSEDLGLEPTINDITEQDIDNLIYR